MKRNFSKSIQENVLIELSLDLHFVKVIDTAETRDHE